MDRDSFIGHTLSFKSNYLFSLLSSLMIKEWELNSGAAAILSEKTGSYALLQFRSARAAVDIFLIIAEIIVFPTTEEFILILKWEGGSVHFTSNSGQHSPLPKHILLFVFCSWISHFKNLVFYIEWICRNHLLLENSSGRTCDFFIYLFIYLFLVFLGLHLQHMEVPRLGVKSEL